MGQGRPARGVERIRYATGQDAGDRRHAAQPTRARWPPPATHPDAEPARTQRAPAHDAAPRRRGQRPAGTKDQRAGQPDGVGGDHAEQRPGWVAGGEVGGRRGGGHRRHATGWAGDEWRDRGGGGHGTALHQATSVRRRVTVWRRATVSAWGKLPRICDLLRRNHPRPVAIPRSAYGYSPAPAAWTGWSSGSTSWRYPTSCPG